MNNLKTRRKITRLSTKIFCALTALGLELLPASAQDPCVRYPQGSIVAEPENLYSTNGVLQVDFTYQTSENAYGQTLYCFVNSDGAQSPTLHVNPGDTLVLTLTNLVPEQPGKPGRMADMPEMELSKAGAGGCGALNMTASSVNIHYHGTNTPPICHQDEVIRTIINSHETFRYEVHFPRNEPPGLYWDHPHIHGIATAAVQGGASGAIIVEGIENVNPKVAGLPQRVLMVRDNPPVNPPPKHRGLGRRMGDRPLDIEPATDLSVNYIPVGGPAYIPAVLSMKPNEKQFWRVVNSAAVTILDLELRYDNEDQPFEVIALDGVPIGSQEGSGKGQSLIPTHLLIPPAGRAEFIVTGPSDQVKKALFLTHKVYTGPGGDSDPTRPLFTITTSQAGAARSDVTMVPAVSGPPPEERFAGLANAKVATTRRLYFSENDTYFFITVEGQRPKPYHMDDPPAIVTTQGSVEEWKIENRSNENHEFHMHQIHFLLVARNGVPVSADDRQILDTVNIPFWSGTGPYPSVTVRMDFRGPDIGDFVYHCHILDHEDGGMMAIIRVLPQDNGSASRSSKPKGPVEASRGAAARTR
jgi:FtsP/CotA-like multicopper oxidase with cupredoxin domain